MNVVAVILDGPVMPEGEAAALHAHKADLATMTRGGEIGATLRFEGIVRRVEADSEQGSSPRTLAALEYESYDPMAQRELEALARGIVERHGLLGLVTLHSRGRVGVGEISFVLMVWSAHRTAALTAMTDFIDRLKQDVPIWKRAAWA